MLLPNDDGSIADIIEDNVDDDNEECETLSLVDTASFVSGRLARCGDCEDLVGLAEGSSVPVSAPGTSLANVAAADELRDDGPHCWYGAGRELRMPGTDDDGSDDRSSS